MESCGMSMIKYLLFIFNLIFSLCGLVLLIIGAVFLFEGNKQNIMEGAFVSACVILIIIGFLIFLIASFGCIGAIRESNLLLMSVACLLIILLLEIIVGIIIAVYTSDFENGFVDGLNKSIKNYNKNSNDKSSWDSIQKNMKCCGVEGPISWQGQNVPASCCHDEDVVQEVSNYCLESSYGKYMYEQGCFNKLKDEIVMKSRVIIGLGIAFAFIEVAGIILSCWLAYTIRNEDKDS